MPGFWSTDRGLLTLRFRAPSYGFLLEVLKEARFFRVQVSHEQNVSSTLNTKVSQPNLDTRKPVGPSGFFLGGIVHQGQVDRPALCAASALAGTSGTFVVY